MKNQYHTMTAQINNGTEEQIERIETLLQEAIAQAISEGINMECNCNGDAGLFTDSGEF